jgi:hypothetical protein
MKLRVAVGCLWAVASAWGMAQAPELWVEQTVAAAEGCPVVQANGHALALAERKAAALASFPVKGCGAVVPEGTRTLAFQGKPLPLPKTKVDRIVVIGDTGCRRSDKETQDCEKDWPFAKIVQFAVAKEPDLVVHVGDYYYREVCPAGEKHCENWENWRKDFFAPAAPLLGAAPWVLARGNHEMCGRAAEGWFRFLDAGAVPLACPAGGSAAESAAFAVKLPGLTLAVVDSADVPETWTAERRVALFGARERAVASGGKAPVWIVTHKPPYVGGLYGRGPEGSATETVDDASLGGVEMFVTGHLHMFGSLSFGPSRPVELIVGDSGTALLKPAVEMDKIEAKVDPSGMLQGELEIDGKKAAYSGRGRFGYMVLERAAAGWAGTLHGVDDEVLAQCSLVERAMTCSPGQATAAKP